MAREEGGRIANRLRANLRRWVKIEEGEGPVLLWSFAYFFFLLSSYYVIRPLRDEMGVSTGDERLTWLFMGTLAGTLAANPVLGALVSRYPRRVFLPVVYHFLTLNLLVFYGLLASLAGPSRLAVAQVFFVWASVFNLFAVSVFWGFMADVFRSDQGKRLFGFIGMGGTLGAVMGASLTAGLAEVIGPVNLFLVAALLLQGAVYCIGRISRKASPATRGMPPLTPEDAPPGHGAWNGIRLAARSPYLLGICLFLLFFTLSSTLLYFEQVRIVRVAFPDPARRTAFFARMDLYVNLLTVFTQCFFTGRIVAAVGVGATLATLPALTITGFAGLAAVPSAWMLALVQTVRRAAEYALIRPAREVLFTVVSREEKYTSKNLIDTFVYRAGDATGALLDKLLRAVNLGTAGICLAFLPVAAAWALLGMVLGRRQAKLAEGRPKS